MNETFSSKALPDTPGSGTHLLESERLRLRGLEPQDLSFFMRCENDSSLWSVCDTRIPFSKYVLEKVLEASHADIYAEKQLRLVIVDKLGNRPIGFLDFFDFSPLHRRTTVGIIIYEKFDRGKGFATEALRIAVRYAFLGWNLHQIFATVTQDNTTSRHLFEKCGFIPCGVRKQWYCIAGTFKDEYLYQLINEETSSCTL